MTIDGIETYNENGEYYTKESLVAGIINHMLLSEAREDSTPKYQSRNGNDEKYQVYIGNDNTIKIKPKDGEGSTAPSQFGVSNYMNTLDLSGIQQVDGKFNIAAAINMGIHNAWSKSQGSCGKYVRYMLEAGFGLGVDGLKGKTPGWACKYDGWLMKNGFRNILNINDRKSQTAWTHNEARPGDIAVMDHGTYGHICMFNGSNWVSDFMQNNMWPYGGDGTCRIYRYLG